MREFTMNKNESFQCLPHLYGNALHDSCKTFFTNIYLFAILMLGFSFNVWRTWRFFWRTAMRSLE